MKKLISIIMATTISLSSVTVLSTGEGHGDLAAPSPWAAEYISKANKIGITHQFKVPWTKDITRAEFCGLAYNMLIATGEKMADNNTNPFSDTDNKKVIALYQKGIIEGKSDTVFAPTDTITREEAAVILDRIGEYFNLIHHEIFYIFTDEKEISDWALNAVQVVCNLGVMNGVDNNAFAPKSGYTVEQAVTTLVRMFDIISPDSTVYMTFADNLNANMPKDRNYMFSPLSIEMALMMAANGAVGTTQQEILRTTGNTDISSYNHNAEAMLEKYSQSDTLRLDVANSVWINSDKTSQKFSNDYSAKIKDIFNASLGVVTNKTAANEINSWVNEKTNGKIPTIVSKDTSDFWAMLVNAVYFKGRWRNTFNPNATMPDVFTSRDGDTGEIDFMNQKLWTSYFDTDGVQTISLPYFCDNTQENAVNMRVSMYLMMSATPFNPQETLEKSEYKNTYIDLSVPKFDIEYEINLNNILNSIGITKAFDTTAEFNKMFTHDNMWFTDVLHKTYINVDEEGTEAAAFTGGGMGGTSMPPQPIELKYNKPFTFVIRDDISGEILFIGEYAYAE